MSTRIPLDIDSEEEAKQLNRDIPHLLGDKLYQRNPDRYASVDVPDVLSSNPALSNAPKSDTSFGAITAFRDGGPFASVTIWEGDEDSEYNVSYGGMAAWDKYGTINNLRTYFLAFDTLLSKLDVLYDEYTVTCPCGFEKTVGSSFVEVREAFNEHNDDHSDRISNTALMGREVTGENKPNTSPEPAQVGTRSES
jgi:hypothetical protein